MPEAALALSDPAMPLAPEEGARADFYALLAALFHRAPDAKLLRTIALAPALQGHEALSQAWSGLVAASAVMDGEALAEEFETLFVGVGKARVSAYAGWYEGEAAAVPMRVRVAEELESLGLARPAGVNEPQDHFAALFEAMRLLVAGGTGRAPASLGRQRRFFETFVRPGAGRFLAAVREASEANYYRKVAAVGEAFLAIENESFDLG